MTDRTPSYTYRYLATTPLLVLLLGLPTVACLAQSPSELDRLIFEPVLINPETGRELPAPSVPLQLLPRDSDAGNAGDEMVQAANPADLSALEITRNITAYREAVSGLEAEEGPFSPNLFEVLIDLASQYQLGGEHESAIEVLERAEHISRVNYGLYHPEQYASIERMIDSYMAMGDYASANEKQRYLVYLSEQHYGQADPKTLPSLVELAKTSMENFNRVLTEDAPVISFSSGSGPGRREPAPKEMAFGSLFVAQQNYLQAISTMIDNRQYFDPMLLNLEYSFLETLLLQSFRSAILEDPDYYLSSRNSATGTLLRRDMNRRYSNGYRYGKDAFERILIYIRNNPEARIFQLVNALMEYGDWNMLFGRTQSAKAKYREAYELVQELGIEQPTIEQLFRPQRPVHLPLVTAKPNSREKFGITSETQLDFNGYIDIAFTVSQYGKAKRFDIIGTSGDVTTDIEHRLYRYLRNSPFRPYLTADGKFDSRTVTMRYYFTYADQVIL